MHGPGLNGASHRRRGRSSGGSCLLLAGVLSLVAPTVGGAAQTLEFAALADMLVERMQLGEGERVLLVGAPGRFDPLVPELRTRIRAAGAIDLGAIGPGATKPEAWSSDFADRLAGMSTSVLTQALREVDLAVMLPGATPADPAYAAMQRLLYEGHGRTIHFHWAGAYDAGGALLPVDAAVDATYVRALLETDYPRLSLAQSDFEAALRGAEVHVTTPLGTDLRFRIGDRPVTRQDGDASGARADMARNLIDREVELPAGAIRVAPLETSVEGTIVFPPSLWNSRVVDGLTLRFEAGKVVEMEATSGLQHAEAVLRRGGESARSFREFALGFNPLLAITEEGWIPYYGYGAGVVRLSLGDNSELGGAVGGGFVRWNFFTDATVRVGDDTWVRDGRLVRDTAADAGTLHERTAR